MEMCVDKRESNAHFHGTHLKVRAKNYFVIPGNSCAINEQAVCGCRQVSFIDLKVRKHGFTSEYNEAVGIMFDDN